MPRPKNSARLVLGVLAVVGLVAPPAFAAEKPSPRPAASASNGVSKTVDLLNINDFHGRITQDIGMGLAATVARQRAENPDSLLLSAGDNVSASLFVSAVQQDNPTIDYLNALGVQASAVGNHEFDKGLSDLRNRLEKRAEFPYLGANVVDAAGKPLLKPYSILTTASGVRVAVVGAVTTETPRLTDPSALTGARFTDPIRAVNEYADRLRDGDPANGEADVVVAEYHEGVNTEAPEADPIVTGTSKNVDVIFTGHTHQKYVYSEPIPGTDRTRPVVQTGDYGGNLAHVRLELDGRNHVVGAQPELIARAKVPTAETVASDSYLTRIQKIVDDAAAYARRVGSEKLADLRAPITTGRRIGADGEPDFDQRDLESSMGHLVADMYLDAANSTGRTPADIGVVNSGGLRDEFPSGLRTTPTKTAEAVTVADANAVTPFANNLWTVRLTGAQLKEVLEEQWQADANGAKPSRPYLQLGLSKNVTYTYKGDASGEGFAERGHHVTGIRVGGKPVQDTDSFTVAVPSFLLGGGDNFTAFVQGTDKKDTAVVDSDGFRAYLKKLGTVSPRYEKQAVRAEGLQDSYDLAGHLTGTVSDLELSSLGAPTPRKLTASIDGKTLGTVPVENGSASLDLSLTGRGLTAGKRTLVLADESTGTRVALDVVLTGEDSTAPVPGTPPAPLPSKTATAPTDETSFRPDPSASASEGSRIGASDNDGSGTTSPAGIGSDAGARTGNQSVGAGRNLPAGGSVTDGPATSGEGLAATGTDVVWAVLGGSGLVGAGILVLARRRRTSERS